MVFQEEMIVNHGHIHILDDMEVESGQRRTSVGTAALKLRVYSGDEITSALFFVCWSMSPPSTIGLLSSVTHLSPASMTVHM